MTRIVVDDKARSSLNSVAGCAEVCDESGHVLGYFHPVLRHDPSLYKHVKSPISSEELQSRRQESGGTSLAEIWQRLGQS